MRLETSSAVDRLRVDRLRKQCFGLLLVSAIVALFYVSLAWLACLVFLLLWISLEVVLALFW